MSFQCHQEIAGRALNDENAEIILTTAAAISTHESPPEPVPCSDEAARSKFSSAPLGNVLEAFRAFAADAISSGDPSELHNAAVEAARKWGLSSPSIRRILAAIGRERPEFRKTAAEWRDEDAGPSATSSDRSLSDEELNQILARHSIETDWENASAARELYRVQVLAIQVLFRNKLPLAVLSFKHTANGCRSSLRIERNGLGVKHEINLNLANIGKSRASRAAHVIHELIHLREALFECREPTGNYHSKRFLGWAAELGIPTTASGAYLGVPSNSPVERLLRYLGIPREDSVVGVAADAASGHSKRSPRKVKHVSWNCGCTEIFAPPGVVVEGQCLKSACGRLWKPAVTTMPSSSAAVPEPERAPLASSDIADQLAAVA